MKDALIAITIALMFITFALRHEAGRIVDAIDRAGMRCK